MSGDVIDHVKSVVLYLERFRVDIQRAIDYTHNSYTLEYVVSGVLRGELHFYPLADAFCIMEVEQYPQRRLYTYFLAGGNMETLRADLPRMEEAAKKFGCDGLLIKGRKGWARAVADLGFDFAYTALIKEVAK